MIKVIMLIMINTALLFGSEGFSQDNGNYTTFSKIDPSIPLLSEVDYLNFIRISILEQPEYLFSISNVFPWILPMLWLSKNSLILSFHWFSKNSLWTIINVLTPKFANI